MLRGIGVDLVHLPSLRAALECDSRAVDRMFSASERAYCSAQPNPLHHLGGTAAAKEAVMKALGTGWSDEVDWLDIAVERAADGHPVVQLSGGAAVQMSRVGATRCYASISHDGDYAVAFVVLEA